MNKSTIQEEVIDQTALLSDRLRLSETTDCQGHKSDFCKFSMSKLENE